MKRYFLYSFGIMAALAAMVIISVISSYNSLVNLDEGTLKSWGDVETAYQRRADLIPNLINVVKGAANFEQETLTKVIEARANATAIKLKAENFDADSFQKFEDAQMQLTSALSKLLAVVENYPELKATQNFRNLQEQLEGTENRIAYVREQFNKFAQLYNVKLKRIPTLFWVKMFYSRFEPHPYFKSEEGAQNAPTVNFSN